MKKLLEKIRRILRDRRTRKLLTRTVSGFAALVVFVTTYALVLPAITMEVQADCGIEAHQHDASCYEDVLICEEEESDGHHHGDSCYTSSTELKCDIPEHAHDETCYDEEGNLICEQLEHTHVDSCYEEHRELTCGLGESDGHHHDSSCYEQVLVCGKEVHTHSEACYHNGGTEAEADEMAVMSDAAYTGASAQSASAEETGDLSYAPEYGNENARTGEEATEAETADPADDSAMDDQNTSDLDVEDVDDVDTAKTEEGSYVPTLDPVIFEQVLNKNTDIYYSHIEEGEVVEDSSELSDWKKADHDTELGRNDILRVYLAYTIPAGSLNDTNDTARYRLPSNIHLTDAQVKAINEIENGIAAQYVKHDNLEVTDTENYHKYLGAEAVEGTRTPVDDVNKYLAEHDSQEYISAVVKVENIYNDQGDYLGQDLIFTFTPYSVQKNQHEYDSNGNPTKAGEMLKGWLTLDFNMEQVDWSEPEVSIYELTTEEASELSEKEAESTEIDVNEVDTEDSAANVENAENTEDNSNRTKVTTVERSEQTADVVFVPEGTDAQNNPIHEIHTKLTRVEETRIETIAETTSSDEETGDTGEETKDISEEAQDETNQADNTAADETAETVEPAAENSEKLPDEKNEDSSPQYKAGTLTSEGTGYKITLDYNADAQIPEKAYLKVSEITRESDAEAYEACLKEAEKTIPTDNKTSVDDKASRFFDIEIFVDEQIKDQTDAQTPDQSDDQNTDQTPDQAAAQNNAQITEQLLKENNRETVTRKIEPAAPVKVNIQLFDTEMSENVDKYDAEQYKVIHFAEEGTEEIQDVTAQTIDAEQKQDHSVNNNTTSDTHAVAPPTELQFETESFSIFGVIYTVDFEYSVNGKIYQLSLPGGGFVSFTDIVEVLGILDDTNNEENSDENSPAADKNEAEENTINVPLTLGDVEISDAAKNFVADVENIAFSSPELVDVSKVDADTTVSQIKENRGLECEYSAELSEEQIAEINATEVKGGDWALISMQPFTSEETLTVTMKNGEVFTIKVTDSQDPYGLDGQSFEMIVNGSKALSPVNETEIIGGVNYQFLNNAVPESGSNLAWKFEYDHEAFGENGSGYYISHEGQYLKIVGDNSSDPNRTVTLVGSKAEATPIAVKYDQSKGKYSFSNKADSSNGFLRQFDDDYFGVDGNANDDNAWFELRDPDHPEKPGLVSPWDVKGDNIRIKLFDYSGTVHNGFINTDIDIDDSAGDYYTAEAWHNGDGINNGRTLIFSGGGLVGQSDGQWNYYTGQQPAVMQGIVKNTLTGGYPELTNTTGSKGASLGYLFGASGQDGVTAYTGTDGNGLKGLLRRDENGYYYYSSEQNYATLVDPETGQIVNDEIHLYSESYNKDNPSVNAKKIGFFPFDPYRQGESKAGEEKGFNGSPYNHQFGMTLEADFALPPNGKLPNGEDMVFEFSGDDDVWVFIDGVLVLDLGGVHQPLSGKIDFAEGKSQVVDASIQTVTGQTNTVGTGRTIKELFEAAGQKYDDSPYSTHTIKFFYLERGGCDSNCTLSFNLDVVKGKGSVDVAKYDQNSQPVAPLKGVKFGLYSDPDCTELMKEITSDGNGIVSFKDLPVKTDDQKYYLKETKELAGYQKDETIYTLEAVRIETGKYRFKVMKDGNEIGTIGQNPQYPVIYNEQLEPINLKVEKQWQSTDGNTITPPEDASATFKVQRYVRTEGDVERPDPSQPVTLKVYRYKDGQNPVQVGSDYTNLKGGSTFKANWGYSGGYLNPDYNNRHNTYRYNTTSGNYSVKNGDGPLELALPASGTANLYIRDENVGTSWGAGVINVSVTDTTPYEQSTIIEHVSTNWQADNAYNDAENCPMLKLPETDGDPWIGNFSNLKTAEIKDDGLSYYYRYYIVETGKTPENAQTVYVDGDGQVVQNASSLQTDVDGKTQTIINKVETTHFSANKSWVNQDGTPATLPAGTSISFHLYADGKDTGKNVVLNGKTDVAEVTDEETQELNTSAIENGAYENASWKAYWGDLLKYRKDENGDWVEIKYTVSEKINAETGFLPEVNEVTEDGGTIKNVRKGTPPDPEIPDPDNTNPEIHKRIDALRDAVGNPDTSLDDDSTNDLTDLYRLYLDYKINSVQEPEGVDLLFVLDHSGSMNSYAFGGNPNRAPTVEAVLNGNNGLIAQFLAMNENNRWAAVGFKGDPGGFYTIPYTEYRAQNAGQNDSEILSPESSWQTQRADIHLPLENGWIPIYVPGEGLLDEGETRLTDYTAGLWRAEQFLKNNDKRKKIVVFISDGIPTLYIPCEGTLENAGTMTGSDYYPDNNGTGGCTQETREQFANFVRDMTRYGYTFGDNAEFYTVGFGDSILSATSGKALLKGMLQDAYGKDVSSTHFVGIGDGSVNETANALRDALGTLIGTRESFSELVIQDDLSQYVDLYGIATAGNDSAAILSAASTKVTMTDPTNTSNVIILYQNGSVTEAGTKILKGVTYDPATKTVKAEFKEGYKAEPGIRYTLSFDVKATEKAYSDFALSGYNSTGDEDTDFKGTNPPNNTSSGKLGFHSNDTAKVTYKHNDEPEEKTYKHPVVQVFPKIRVVKEDQTGRLLEGATFELYKEGYDPSKTSQENADYKLKEMISGKENDDSTDALIYEDVLKPGIYYLVETKAPDGYIQLETPIRIEVKEDQETGAITVEASIDGTDITYPKLSKDNKSANWRLIVVNDAGAALPNTGGPGTRLFTILGSILILGAGVLLYRRRRIV